VKAVNQRDNRASFRTIFVVRIFSRALYGTFVCLRARIAEENLFQSGFFAEQLRKLNLRLREVEV